MKDIEKLYAQAFGTPVGARVLAHLRETTVERYLGDNATEAQLRTLEAQRALVKRIEALVARGRGFL
jgi:hypothetical protein